MSDLGPWLEARAWQRRSAGVQDCCTLPCDWAMHRGFPDPMATWRGTYASEDEAAAIIAHAGGLLPLFRAGFAAIPERTGPPVAGDVGLVAFDGFEAGAIFTGRRWAFVGSRGIGFASVDPDCVAAIWAVGG